MDAPSKNKRLQTEKEFERALNFVRWLIYSIIFSTLLIPFCSDNWQIVTGGIILGFFAGLLNEINSNLKK